MKFADLSPEIIERIKTLRYDRIVEKHEGPWRWSNEIKYGELEFLSFEGRDVLLPILMKQRPNITLLRCIVSEDGNTLTLFLKDTTYTSPDDDFDSGRVAICERMSGTAFYIAVMYHEWFILENPGLR